MHPDPETNAAAATTAPVAWAVAAPIPWMESGAWIAAGSALLLAAVCWLLFRKGAVRAAAADASGAATKTALDAARLKIQDFAASQARFVGNLAQELEAPLATVLVHADLLLASSEEPATVQRHARIVAEDVRHLSTLVESFLRLAGPFPQERHHVPVPFHDVVLKALHRCQSLAAGREVSVVPMLAESNVEVEVLGDAVLLEAMIENLVRNAVLSAPRGTRVDLHVRIQGDEITLSVCDHGARLDDADLESVFDGFFLDPSRPRPMPGTGLSLAVAKRVAEHHRGSISMRNLPDGGCEFAVQLPRWRSDGTAAMPPTVPSTSPTF